MNLAERLRSVVRPAGNLDAERAVPAGCDTANATAHANVAEVLGGEWQESGGARYLVVDTRYAPGFRLGRVAVAECAPGESDEWPSLSTLTGNPGTADPGPLVFVDVETTGLAGGAGTYAFLIGCGFFKDSSFHVRQFFLASYGAERALLQGVAEMALAAGALVTYNGKSFDLPLIETRFLYHRLKAPLSAMPHIDMLHPARHLWREERDDAVASCRLADLEQAVLGHLREHDVAGFEIPARYFHFVRTTDPRPLQAVLEHNRLDLLALAMVTARAAWLLAEGAEATRTVREALGLGRLYERAGLRREAKACFTRAADAWADLQVAPSNALRAEALRAYALLARRDRDFDAAASAWRRALQLPGCPPRIVREATEALAVHHEHRAGDLEAARSYALRALQLNTTTRRVEAVQYRLGRLNRKLGEPGFLGHMPVE